MHSISLGVTHSLRCTYTHTYSLSRTRWRTHPLIHSHSLRHTHTHTHTDTHNHTQSHSLATGLVRDYSWCAIATLQIVNSNIASTKFDHKDKLFKQHVLSSLILSVNFNHRDPQMSICLFPSFVPRETSEWTIEGCAVNSRHADTTWGLPHFLLFLNHDHTVACLYVPPAITHSHTHKQTHTHS